KKNAQNRTLQQERSKEQAPKRKLLSLILSGAKPFPPPALPVFPCKANNPAIPIVKISDN
ncbi:MAG: hypothetical protein K2J70_04115, partial [Muribaculaceae bacterium]|nr:hypothetical protein [Muribaculaceae bacterium]